MNNAANCLTKDGPKSEDLTGAKCPGTDCNCSNTAFGSSGKSQLNCKFGEDNPNFCVYGVECLCVNQLIQ